MPCPPTKRPYDPKKITRRADGSTVAYVGTDADDDYVFQVTHSNDGRKYLGQHYYKYDIYTGRVVANPLDKIAPSSCLDLVLPYEPKVGDKVWQGRSTRYTGTIVYLGPLGNQPYGAIVVWDPTPPNNVYAYGFYELDQLEFTQGAGTA